jgi:hypothetical protein
MQVIEVKPVHGGWEVIDATTHPGWVTMFPGDDGLDWAIKFVRRCQAFDHGEIRVLNSTGDLVDTIRLNQSKTFGG